jgi:hypothetical protein
MFGKKNKMHHRSLNFLWCVIPVHELLKRVIVIPKLRSVSNQPANGSATLNSCYIFTTETLSLLSIYFLSFLF